MADDGMDLCGAIWNHEMAMRRLLSLVSAFILQILLAKKLYCVLNFLRKTNLKFLFQLRQSQQTCSDTQCFQPCM